MAMDRHSFAEMHPFHRGREGAIVEAGVHRDNDDYWRAVHSYSASSAGIHLPGVVIEFGASNQQSSAPYREYSASNEAYAASNQAYAASNEAYAASSSSDGNKHTEAEPPTTDANGNVIVKFTDGTSEKHKADGTVVHYDAQGHVTSVDDSTGSHEYHYTNGQLDQVTEYDANHQVTKIWKKEGDHWQAYQPDGKTKCTDAGSTVKSITVDKDGNETRSDDPATGGGGGTKDAGKKADPADSSEGQDDQNGKSKHKPKDKDPANIANKGAEHNRDANHKSKEHHAEEGKTEEWGTHHRRFYNIKDDGSAEYTVRKHDTLWNIAADILRHRHPGKEPSPREIKELVDAIAKENHLDDPNKIVEGKKLKIPAESKEQS